MIPILLSDIARITGGELVGADFSIEQLSTDSRALTSGDVFLALKGDNFDGHKFSQQAEQQGCVALIVSTKQAVNISQVVVGDTRIALGKIGAYVKAQVAPKTVGITGSSGKTTVKEMVAAILSRLGHVLATDGNFNNDIGVPLTLLRLTQKHNYAVIEMGANHMGEIAYTSALVKPDVAIINNIAAAHLEGFGDLCGVARAKGEIFEGLAPNGVALYNQDSLYANKWQWRLENKNVRLFSCLKPSDCYSSEVVFDENGCANFKLSTHQGNTFIQLTVPGQHNVCNAVAAAAVALELGASLDDIRLGLAQMKPVQGRMNLHHVNDRFTVIDDTYNANVESIKAAIDLLAQFPGRRVLILGDMAELGADARSYHQDVGQYAEQLAINDLLTLGVLSQATSGAFSGSSFHFSDRQQLLTTLKTLLTDEEQQISILVKGSRSSKMELVVADILAWRANTHVEEQA